MADDLHYDLTHIAFLEALWGDGYLSPGGPDEVRRVLEAVDLRGKRVLDIGCGSGGITATLVTEHGAQSVVGIDVERPVVSTARERIEASNLSDKVDIQLVEPGPLPFNDGHFDVVFSKDSIVHIADKRQLADSVFRVLVPGGWFAASDWLIGHDGEPSPEMQHYLRLEDLGFGMASPEAYAEALTSAGFTDVKLTNRNQWYAQLAREERDRLVGPERSHFEEALNVAEVAEQIQTWDAMLVVLDSGEHCPHHLRARKPID